MILFGYIFKNIQIIGNKANNISCFHRSTIHRRSDVLILRDVSVIPLLYHCNRLSIQLNTLICLYSIYFILYSFNFSTPDSAVVKRCRREINRKSKYVF
jgi:hypothetical protein